MSKILISSFKYLFVFDMLFFLLQGFLLVLVGQGVLKANKRYLVRRQIYAISLFHILSFLILAFTGENLIEILVLGLISFVDIILVYLIFKYFCPQGCSMILTSVLFLTDIGLVMLMRLNTALATKQLIWYIIGFAVMFLIIVLLKFIKKPEKLKYIFLLITITLQVVTLVMGNTRYGATSWLTIKGFTFQPSEIIKLSFVFYLASAFKDKKYFRELLDVIIPCIVVILLFVLQRDLGSALTFFMIFLVMLYVTTNNTILAISSLCLAFFGGTLSYFLFSHIKVRLMTWIDPWSDISNKGYQITQSLFAIGSGGLFGSGLTLGMPNYIPVVEKDFIFSAICEEFGLLFAIGLIFVYMIIFLRGAKIALACENVFYRLVATNLTSMLCFQVFLIIGGNIKLLPLTGVTLPFVSYGGTSVVSSFVIIGILEFICIREKANERISHRRNNTEEEYYG